MKSSVHPHKIHNGGLKLTFFIKNAICPLVWSNLLKALRSPIKLSKMSEIYQNGHDLGIVWDKSNKKPCTPPQNPWWWPKIDLLYQKYYNSANLERSFKCPEVTPSWAKCLKSTITVKIRAYFETKEMKTSVHFQKIHNGGLKSAYLIKNTIILLVWSNLWIALRQR